MRLRSPGQGGVRHDGLTLLAGRLEPRHLAALLVQVPAELARNVHHSESALVVRDVQQPVFDPDVVRSGLRHLVPSDLLWVLDVAHVHHVDVPARAVHAVAAPEDLISGEDVVSVPVGGMGVAVFLRLVGAILVLGDELRLPRRAALDAVSDVQDDQSIVPVGEVGEAVLRPHVVQALVLLARPHLPATDVPGVRRVRHLDDVHGARAVVHRVDDVPVDPDVMDSRRQAVGQLGDDRRVRGIGEIQHDNPVAPVARSLAGDHRPARVRVHLHVVHHPCVHHHRVGEHRRARIRHVPRVHALSASLGVSAGVRVIASVPALEDPQVARRHVRDRAAADELADAASLPWRRLDDHRRRLPACRHHHAVCAGRVRHEGRVTEDLGSIRRAIDRRHRVAEVHIVQCPVAAPGYVRREVYDVAGADPARVRLELDRSHRVGLHVDIQRTVEALSGGREHSHPGRPERGDAVGRD